MAGGNPVLARIEKQSTQPDANYPGGGAPGMVATPASPRRAMTIDDVVIKTGITFVILVAAAVVGWTVAGTASLLAFGSAFVAFILAMVVIFKKKPSPLLVILYAVFEGFFLGGISRWYQAYGEANGTSNLVLQAVSATLIVFAVMLFAYKSGLIKVTSRSRKIFMIMLFSYAAIGLISLIAAIFGVGGGWGFYGVGGIGILLSLVAVALASYSLVIDFDGIVQASRYGIDEKESWRMAFGLMVTLVWLYLELLRLLAIVNRQ